jgi:hypothetical protein
MKICPLCQTQYEDDTLDKCPNDGTLLVLVDKLEKNPTLPQVVSAPPDAITSEFDVEAVQREADAQKTPTKQAPRDEVAADAPQVVTLSQVEPSDTRLEPTHDLATPISPPKPKTSKSIYAVIALVVLVGLAVASYFLFFKSDLVKVELRSNPSGATVLVDGKEVGRSPVQTKVEKGLHEVIFEQRGYESIQETILVSDESHIVVKDMKPIQTP